VIWFGGTGKPDLNGLLDIILVPLTMYWMVKNLLVTRLHLKWLLYGLVLACLLICLTGLFEQALGVRVFKGSTELQYIWQDVPGGRAAGAMLNPAIYGATLGMGILAGICCLSHVKGKITKIAIVASIGVMLYGVLASYTRSAWLSVSIVLFIAQFFVKGLWKKSLPILLLGFLILVLFWQVLPGISIIVKRAMVTKTVTQRVDLINLGWKLFLEKPFLGWGSGALNDLGTRKAVETSHNIFLTFLVDGGVVLFLAFSLFIGYLLIRAVRVYGMTGKGSLERNALVAMTGSVLIFLLSGLALELRYFGYFNVLFWICAGVIDLLGTRSSSVEKVFP
jgi:O-antigen ligase